MIEDSRTPTQKVAYLLLGLLIVYAVIRSIEAAAGKPFWYDEILTLTVSSLDSWTARLTALRLPLDGQPPLFYWFEHLALRFSRNQEIALRLPSIIAFPVTLICVFVYLRKAAGEIVAFLSTFALLLTAVFQVYAVEARPYSMVVACFAFALLCYQRVPSPLWVILLALSLALAESLHYLSVLSIVPFGLAEVFVFSKTRRIRWQVWAALAAGAVPLLLQWKLLAINQAYYGAYFWAKFHYYYLPAAYGEYLGTTSRIGGAVFVVVFAGAIGALLWRRSASTSASEANDEELTSAVLLLSFAALPFIGHLSTTIVHAGFTPRYVLCTVLGLVLGFGFILARSSQRAVMLFGIFVLAAVTIDEIHFWRFFRQDISQVRMSGVQFDRFIENAGYKDLPVVVLDENHFLELVHYAPDRLHSRLVLLTR
ncbi:MAG: glycosyltransferase family 39 protein, partial [Candidatus Acidiferrum sp.]